jgi:phenylacetate-CoA ligase
VNIIFKFALVLNGFSYRKAIKELCLNHKISEREKAKLIYNFHVSCNKYYRNFVNIKGIANNQWADIPIIRKKDFLPSFYFEFEKNKRYYHFHNTSGSSGKPFKVVKNKLCHALTWAYIDKLYRANNINYGSSKQARFYGMPLDFLSNFKEKIKDFLLNRIRFSVYNLNDESLEFFLRSFKKNKFEYAYGYTTVLVLFSKYLIKNKIKLSELCPSLNLVICTSETCSDVDKKLIELAFGVKVIIEYGASELDVLAFTNEFGELEVNDLTVYIEVLDMEQDIEVNDGDVGRLIVTSLYNKALPFIRYEVGDLGAIEVSKNNGKRILTKLEGRINDLILLPSGKVAAGFTLYYLLKDIIYNLDLPILEYRIIQKQKDLFVFEYISEKVIDVKLKKLIESKFELYLEFGLQIEFLSVDFIKREKSGKFKHFISELKQS